MKSQINYKSKDISKRYKNKFKKILRYVPKYFYYYFISIFKLRNFYFCFINFFKIWVIY